MRPDFCALILTHGRPGAVMTVETLRKFGYTGAVFLVVDDEDSTADEYERRYPGQVVTFSKAAIAETFDEGDNLPGRRGVVYARNASFGIAESLGFRYFIQLDDDYYDFQYRWASDRVYGGVLVRDLDACFEALLDFMLATPALTVATSQGGDHIGGGGTPDRPRPISLKRKAMNSFICAVDRPFQFVGRINEDTNAYTLFSRTGGLFLTVMQIQLDQADTQQNGGGMTSLYLDSGTYVKSFYSVMYAPSCVTVAELLDHHGGNARLHHRVDWDACAPRILSERHRKP